jgi:hypothetical protein
MNRSRLLALVALPLSLALTPWSADLDFKPEDGSKAKRHYSVELDFELGDITVVADGQDLSEMVPGDFEATVEIKVQTNDHFVRTAGGRPLELIRTFDALEGEVSGMGESQPIDGLGDLVGKSVRFLWNEDDEDYDVSYHEGEGDADMLTALAADMDLSVLLPGRSVAEGDTWTVSAEALEKILLFGTHPDTSDADEMAQLIEAELVPQFEKLMESFETTCEFKGEREVEGRKLGVIALNMHGEGVIDLEPVILAAVEAQDAGVEIDMDIQAAQLKLSFTGKGEALWDMSRGILSGFDLGADMEFVMDLALSADVQGESHELEADAELLGRGVWKVRTPAE